MKVTVNFEVEEFPESSLSIAEIMTRKRFTFQHVITRLNGALVSREKRGSATVSDGDELEVYHLVSGG